MKAKLLSGAVVLAFVSLSPTGRAAIWIVDPGLGDTVRIDSVVSQNTGTAVVPINFYNDEPLGGIEITIEIQSASITVDSFSWVGGRANGPGTIRNVAQFASGTLTIATIPASDNPITAGSGLLGKLYVHYPVDIPEETAIIDSITIVNGFIVYQTSFSDASANRFRPQFRRGAIAIRQGCCVNRRGNINNDAKDAVNISDLSYLVSYLFKNGPAPVCREEANINGDSKESINVVDLSFIVNYLFKNGAQPQVCP